MFKHFSFLTFVSFAAMCSLALSACSNESKTAAGGTEAESTIAMQIRLADGTPAAMARVRVLPTAFLSDGLDTVGWTDADENGRVEFEQMDPGSYTVEARSLQESVASGAVLDVELREGSSLTLDSVNLGELSTIEGYVAAGQGPSVIRIPGLERFVVPNSSGHYVIDSLPAGDFSVLIESRSNRGSVTLQASAGEVVPEVSLGAPRGFAVENFESFSGKSATGEILGDGWWYTLDADGKNLLPLWDETLTMTYSGSEGCASGGCARTTNRLGFLLGVYKTDYVLPSLDTLMFSARGTGKLEIRLSYGDADSVESGLLYEQKLSKVWQGFSIPVGKMTPYGKASKPSGDSKQKVIVSRIDFRVSKGDTVFLDDVYLGGVNKESLDSVSTPHEKEVSKFSKDWKAHDALLAEVQGYAKGVRGGAGPLDGSENVGEICIVTTTDDYIIVEDTTATDSAATQAIIAPGSLRECAYKDTSVWILFEKSGTYNLQSPLRIKSNKTIDGRGRDIRIAGMGILTDKSSNLIFENLTFTEPSITTLDSTSRRALSIHNGTNYVWVDHCTFERYPLVQMDIKRCSKNVTVSWSRFEDAQTGILFGLKPDLSVDSVQMATLHHNYFANMSSAGILARFGSAHIYNNFFMDVDNAGVECTDSARCFIENNIFNIETPVAVYRLFDDDGVPFDSTIGFPQMQHNWYSVGGEDLKGDAQGYKPGYKYAVDNADADLAWRIKESSGPR